MKFNINNFEAGIVVEALCTAMDNEGDKSPCEAIGREPMEGVGVAVAVADKILQSGGGGVIEIGFLEAAVLLKYLYAVERSDPSFSTDPDTNEFEAARLQMISALETFECMTIEKQVSIKTDTANSPLRSPGAR
jgi:hypothetical protein